MPHRAFNLKVGNSTFIMPDVQNAHTVTDEKLGPSGPVNFPVRDLSGGLLSAEDGIAWQPNKYLSARGTDAAWPGQVLIQAQATTISVGSGQVALIPPLKSVDFTSGGNVRHYLVGTGNTIFRTNTDTPPVWQSVGSLGGEPATDIITYGGAVGVAHGSGFKHSTDGATWTADTDDADAFGVLGNTLYRADRPNTIYAGSGASFGTAWDSGSTVGDVNFNINSFAAVEQLLLIGREDGIHSIDGEGTVVPFTPELRGIANSVFASPARTAVFNGDYYFATQYGLIQISGLDGQKRRIGLDQLASPDFPTPQVRALTSDDRYLYVLVQNTSTDLTILRRNIYGAWHVFYWDGTSNTKSGQHLGVSSALGYPALFFSYEGGYNLTDTFTDISKWTLKDGSAVGSVANNILTAGNSGTWSITAGSVNYTDGRWVAATKLVTRANQYRVTKYVSDANQIFTAWNNSNFQLIQIASSVATTVQVGASLATDTWVWMELEANGTNYTGRLYTAGTGAAPTALASSTPYSVLSVVAPNSAYATGQISLLSTASINSQWGGIASSPGGAFVQQPSRTQAIRLSTFPNPLQDTSYRYSTLDQDHWVRLGRIGPFESNVILDRCYILSENLTANITITPYVSVDGAAAAQFGSSAATSSPTTEIKPTTAIEGRYFDVYAYLDTNSASTSPVLKSISFRGRYQPGTRRTHKFLVAAKGSYSTPAGDFTIQDPVTTINNLQTLRTTDGYVTVVDENGQEFSGAVEDVQRVTVPGFTAVDKTPEHVVQVTIAEKA